MLAAIENPVLWWTSWAVMTATGALLCNILIMGCWCYRLRTATYVIRGAVMGAVVVTFVWLLLGCTPRPVPQPTSMPATTVTPEPTPSSPLTIDLRPDRHTVTLALDNFPNAGEKAWLISVPPSKSIIGETFDGNGKGAAIAARGDMLILNCTIRNWAVGVSSDKASNKVWIVNSTIENCTDYAAYLPGTGSAVIGSTLAHVGGTVLRFPHYTDCVVYNCTLEDSARRLLLKAHNATRLGKPFSSGLWIEKCRFIGGPTQDYLATFAAQNRNMVEDVRGVDVVDCDFVFGARTRIGALFGGTDMRITNCRFNATQGTPTRHGIVGERQGSSPYAHPVVTGCTIDGSELVRR